MRKYPEPEILIDPAVLSLVWGRFASEDLLRNRQNEGEEPPSDLDGDNYFYYTSNTIFGENHEYPLDFFKEVLFFTTRIRTPFSGKKFICFKDMLYDQVAPVHHGKLSHIRPLFDDPAYYRFRYAELFVSRPWDTALRGYNPAEFGQGSQDHLYRTSIIGAWGLAVKQFFRFLNEDTSSDFLIDEILELRWPNGEPMEFSMGFPQLLTDYMALHQFSFGMPYFSINDISHWTKKPFAPQHSETAADAIYRNIEHAISVTFPTMKPLTFDDILELREDRFFECYRTMVLQGGLQGLSKEDVNEMLRQDFLRSSEACEYGTKEILIDIGKFVASLVPYLDKVVGIGDETLRLPSRFQRFNNRWLWFVKNARKRTGLLFSSISESQKTE